MTRTKRQTFDEALREAREKHDREVAETRRAANVRLARRVRELMTEHGQSISAAAAGLGRSRATLHDYFRQADNEREENGS